MSNAKKPVRLSISVLQQLAHPAPKMQSLLINLIQDSFVALYADTPYPSLPLTNFWVTSATAPVNDHVRWLLPSTDNSNLAGMRHVYGFFTLAVEYQTTDPATRRSYTTTTNSFQNPALQITVSLEKWLAFVAEAQHSHPELCWLFETEDCYTPECRLERNGASIRTSSYKTSSTATSLALLISLPTAVGTYCPTVALTPENAPQFGAVPLSPTCHSIPTNGFAALDPVISCIHLLAHTSRNYTSPSIPGYSVALTPSSSSASELNGVFAFILSINPTSPDSTDHIQSTPHNFALVFCYDFNAKCWRYQLKEQICKTNYGTSRFLDLRSFDNLQLAAPLFPCAAQTTQNIEKVFAAMTYLFQVLAHACRAQDEHHQLLC